MSFNVLLMTHYQDTGIIQMTWKTSVTHARQEKTLRASIWPLGTIPSGLRHTATANYGGNYSHLSIVQGPEYSRLSHFSSTS